MNKIFTFGDGFAAGHIWPEWPQILQALLPDYQIINTSMVGAGPEWLVHQLVAQLDQVSNHLVIFQWPIADRFDKLIEDDHWKHIADSCAVYAFNQQQIAQELWWCSSASTQAQVQQYHREFVQKKQHELRLKNYQLLVQNTLLNLQCEYLQITTDEQEQFSQRTEYRELRLSQVQPSPLVHLEFIEKILMVQMPQITFNKTRLAELKHRISSHNWQAYDPDRNEVWTQMSTFKMQ